MAKALGGLLVRLGRRRTQKEGAPEGASGDEPMVDADAMPLESAALDPSLTLVPATIFRQVLFDAAELTPAWAKPRPAAAPDVAKVAPADESTSTKRTRRPKPNSSSSTSRPRTRRVAKADHGPTDG